MGIHNRIIEITNILGESISDAKPIENFKEPTTALLDGFEYVEKLNRRNSTVPIERFSECSENSFEN